MSRKTIAIFETSDKTRVDGGRCAYSGMGMWSPFKIMFLFVFLCFGCNAYRCGITLVLASEKTRTSSAVLIYYFGVRPDITKDSGSETFLSIFAIIGVIVYLN